MAFNPQNLTLTSSPVNPNVTDFPVPVVPASPLPQQWSYYAGSDTIATVEAAGYFKYFAGWQNTAAYNDGHYFQKGDLIYCVCNDGNTTLCVTQVGSTIDTDALAQPAGAITTADLANNAVTAAKIANATITTTQISNTAGITGAQLANNTVTATQIANGTITTTQISGTAGITGSQIAATTITGSNLAANTLGSGQIDPTVIQYVRVPMTAAQWNGMYAAPMQLIAAPGAGKAIIVHRVDLSMTFVSAQYAAGGAVICQYDSTINGGGTNACGTSTIAAATVNGYAASSAVGLAGLLPSSAATAIANKGLYLSNQTGAFTTGDSTWNIFVWYSVVTL